MTPESTNVPYITPADFLARKDANSISQYVCDTPNTPIPSSQLPTILYTNTNLLVALNSACGELESACLRGQAYAVSDLQSLQGASLDYMKTILSDIATYRIMTRRLGPAPPETVVQAYNEAMASLDALSRGERIFSFQQSAQAGVAATVPMPQFQGFANNLISARWGAFFGLRQSERRWPGSGGGRIF